MTAKLISAFVFATRIVQSLLYLNPKFQASSHLLLLYSLVWVRPGQKPRRPVFSERGSFKGSNQCCKGRQLCYLHFHFFLPYCSLVRKENEIKVLLCVFKFLDINHISVLDFFLFHRVKLLWPDTSSVWLVPPTRWHSNSRPCSRNDTKW